MLSKIFEAAKTGMCVIGKHGEFVEVNKACCEMLGYARQELIGQNFSIIFPENIRKYATNLHFEYIKGLTEESSGEWKVLDKQGNEKEVYITTGRITTEAGEIYKIATVTDITEKKREIERSKKALEEKDAFIQKMHHLVKNNLNIIAGLLLLQSQNVKDNPDVYNLFVESINRIKAVSITHEQLHSQDSFSEIDLGKYILALSNSLRATYAASAKNITVHVHVDDVKLYIDKAITCGLIINEALSNSFKYAFKPDQAGEIQLSVMNNGYKLAIKVSDNGRGLPPNFNLENAHTLGMQLIKTLSRQLNAELYIGGDEGTEISLTFNI